MSGSRATSSARAKRTVLGSLGAGGRTGSQPAALRSRMPLACRLEAQTAFSGTRVSMTRGTPRPGPAAPPADVI